MPRLGLLGCGNIGGIIARHAPRSPFVAVYERVPECGLAERCQGGERVLGV
jgi:prephenate dehydrogenase